MVPTTAAPSTLALGALREGSLDLSKQQLKSDTLPRAQIAAAAPVLRTLDLACNSLGFGFELPALPLLVELRLCDNVLSAVDVQRAAPLPDSLRVLDLSSNRLTLLPPCILRLPQLCVLKLDRQRLRALPEELSMLQQLVELDAGFNELQLALPLKGLGLPSLRRLCLRSNGLSSEALTLSARTLPSLTELDLAGNKLASWPSDLGTLDSLRTLSLANNALSTLVSASTMPHRRMWVPSAGVQTLTQLVELSVAQNALAELPTALRELRALRRLDVRCNPLTPAAVRFASTHCAQCGARLLSSAIQQAAPGLLLGDESSAWHRPTLLRMHVRAVLSLGAAPPDGVPTSRLAAKMPDEFALVMGGMGGGGGVAALAVEAPQTPGGASAQSASVESLREPLVTVESLRRAFHAAALRLHPDKQPEEQREAAADAFGKLQAAYRSLGRAVAMERRRLPELDGIRYAFLELPAVGAAGGEALTNEGDVPSTGSAEEAAALASAFRTQLPSALAFARESRGAADGELLVHPAGGPAASSLAIAVLLAILIDADESPTSLQAASRALCASLGWESLPSLPAPILSELQDFAAQSLRQRLRVTRAADATIGNATGRAAAASEVASIGGDGVPPAGRRRYSPNLSIVDPFGGLTMEDPFGDDSMSFDFHSGRAGGEGRRSPEAADDAIDVSDSRLRPTGGVADGLAAVATGDAGDTYAETPLPAENGQRHTSELFATRAPTLSIGDEEDDDDLRIDGGEHEAGWSVDGRGRSVLHVPGGRAFTAVIVEHAEGARRTGGGSFAVG